MINRRYPRYPDDNDYTTNSPSYYEDLARKNKLIQLLAEKIWDYDERLDERLEDLENVLQDYLSQWDERIENLDDEVSHIFVTWLEDGTLEQIINHDVLGNKADKSFVDAELEKVNTQLAHIERLNYNKVSITQFDIPSDKDITSIINALDDNKILVLDDEYFVSEPITLKNKLITGGKLTYTGNENVEYFIRIRENAGVYEMDLHIAPSFYSGAILLVDYDDNANQFVIKDKYIIYRLNITNNDVTKHIESAPSDGNVVTGSSVIKINLRRYKVVAYQNIEYIKFDGVCDIGILIEMIYESEDNNPVYNTSTWKDIAFTTVNQALKVFPKMLTGQYQNSRGRVELKLINFSNQYRKNIVSKPFMELVNTLILGDMIIPWDYNGNAIPEEGIYKTHKSTILLDYNRFPDTKNENDDVYHVLGERSTGELYSGLNVVEAREIDIRPPLRGTGIGWGIDNIKNVVFNTPNGARYVGFEFQQSSSNDSRNRTWQIGISVTGRIVKRIYNSETGEWENYHDILSEGNMPVISHGRRAVGKGIGDMRFDTTKNKPYWWTGTEWVNANGENEFPVDY